MPPDPTAPLRWRSPRRASSAWFLVAGGLLLVQVVLIGLQKYQIGSFSEVWMAPPAITALVASLVGLVGLYPHVRDESPRLAKAGRGAALLAGGLLGVAAIWIIASVISGRIPQQQPAWFLAVTAAFMLTFMLGFVFTAAALLRVDRSSRLLGCLLLAPVIAWSVILIAGLVTSFGDALKLDFYTNGVVAIAFIAVGRMLRRGTLSHRAK